MNASGGRWRRGSELGGPCKSAVRPATVLQQQASAAPSGSPSRGGGLEGGCDSEGAGFGRWKLLSILESAIEVVPTDEP